MLCCQGIEEGLEGGKCKVLVYFPTLSLLLLEYKGVLGEATQPSHEESVSPLLSCCLLCTDKPRGIDKHWEARNVLSQQNAALQISQDTMQKGNIKI